MEEESSGFYYLDTSLEFNGNSNLDVNRETFKNCILYGLENIFGEYGTYFPVDIVNYDQTRGRGTLRCPDTFYVKFRAALTLTGEFQNYACCLNIHKVTRNLAALQSKSDLI